MYAHTTLCRVGILAASTFCIAEGFGALSSWVPLKAAPLLPLQTAHTGVPGWKSDKGCSCRYCTFHHFSDGIEISIESDFLQPLDPAFLDTAVVGQCEMRKAIFDDPAAYLCRTLVPGIL
jgi:hypothetical protein